MSMAKQRQQILHSLLNNLPESRIVDFNIGPKVGELDIKVRDTALEQESRVVGVVAS